MIPGLLESKYPGGFFTFGQHTLADQIPPRRLPGLLSEASVAFLRDLRDSPEWVRMAVRDPARPLTNPAYPGLLYESVVDVFEPWWQRGNPADFADMLRDQHLVMTSPRDGSAAGYRGASDGEGYPFPGRLRSDRTSGVTTPVGFTISAIKHLGGRLPASLAASQAEYESRHQQKAAGKIPWAEQVVHEVALEGIPSELRPRVEVARDQLRINYAKGKDVERYVSAMGQLMERIRLGVGTLSTEEAVTEIARYVQLGAAAHPFALVNFSLVMSHANYALMSYGLRGVSHGDLDHRAAVSSTPEFVAAFRAEVRAANPGRLGPDTEAGAKVGAPRQRSWVKARDRADATKSGDRWELGSGRDRAVELARRARAVRRGPLQLRPRR